mgnify:CR=1 FL=1
MFKRDDLQGFSAAPKRRNKEAEPEAAAPKPEPAGLFSIRGAPPPGRGLNKRAIVVAIGALSILLLGAAAQGLGTRTGLSQSEKKPPMSSPARPEMAKGRLALLPETYEDAARLERINSTNYPVLGPAMAGDIPAPVNEGAGGDLGIDPASFGMRARAPGASGSAQQPTVGSTTPAPDEAEIARKAGLFFGRGRNGGARFDSAPAINQIEAADRDLMTSPHKLLPPESDLSLHPGTIISASLITAINSDSPGPVLAQVTERVFDSATGQRLIIPQGARLIGNYKSSRQYGERRIAIIWSRLIMPDGSQIVLNEIAVAPSGAAGIAGRVDDHWDEAFGAAILGTLINIGAAATESRDRVDLTYNGIGVLSGNDPVEDAARRGVTRTASGFSNRVIDRGLSVPPTIRIKAGAKISVIVTRELAF